MNVKSRWLLSTSRGSLEQSLSFRHACLQRLASRKEKVARLLVASRWTESDPNYPLIEEAVKTVNLKIEARRLGAFRNKIVSIVSDLLKQPEFNNIANDEDFKYVILWYGRRGLDLEVRDLILWSYYDKEADNVIAYVAEIFEPLLKEELLKVPDPRSSGPLFTPDVVDCAKIMIEYFGRFLSSYIYDEVVARIHNLPFLSKQDFPDFSFLGDTLFYCLRDHLVNPISRESKIKWITGQKSFSWKSAIHRGRELFKEKLEERTESEFVSSLINKLLPITHKFNKAVVSTLYQVLESVDPELLLKDDDYKRTTLDHIFDKVIGLFERLSSELNEIYDNYPYTTVANALNLYLELFIKAWYERPPVTEQDIETFIQNVLSTWNETVNAELKEEVKRKGIGYEVEPPSLESPTEEESDPFEEELQALLTELEEET